MSSTGSSTVLHRPSKYSPYLSSTVHLVRLPQDRGLLPKPDKETEFRVVRGAACYEGVLLTPPAEDNMSTAYQSHCSVPASSSYGNQGAPGRRPNRGDLVRNSGAGEANMVQNRSPNDQFDGTQQYVNEHQQQELREEVLPRPQQQYQAFQSQAPPQQYHSSSHQASANPGSCHSISQPQSGSSSNSSRVPSSPASAMSDSQQGGATAKEDEDLKRHSLELPTWISPNGGSLDHFAALMTCFFWFENMETIATAGTMGRSKVSHPLSNTTRPSPGYKKWVHSILATTQVTQNVVLLALLFIYRLRKINPMVHGSQGSQYRLLTVALMLGNKFLDDNTYTNKTWAEVSGIDVKEIHVMEVEFLSNVRYNLLASKSEWTAWKAKLRCFYEYCEEAEQVEKAAEWAAEWAAELSAARQRQAARVPLNMASHFEGDRAHDFSSPLPSPTNVLQSCCTSVTAYPPSPQVHGHTASQAPQWHGSSYQQQAVSSPLAGKPNLAFPAERKRSKASVELVEPAPKRVHRQPPVLQTGIEPVRLPVPQLSLDTSQGTASHTSYPPSNYTPSANYPAAMALPPLVSGKRAMSTVFSSGTTWPSQGSSMVPCGPQTPSGTTPSHFGTPSRRHSPARLVMYGSSPMTESFASRTPTHMPMHNSPRVYLQLRHSPYKPVRPVNTLNFPAPSIPLAEYHMGSSQMHYQPLGKSRNIRTGIVPEFLAGYGSGRSLNQAPPHYA